MIRCLSTASLLGFLITTPACGDESAPTRPPATGFELVEAAITYHDPGEAWPTLRHTLVISQSRPDAEPLR